MDAKTKISMRNATLEAMHNSEQWILLGVNPNETSCAVSEVLHMDYEILVDVLSHFLSRDKKLADGVITHTRELLG